MLVVGFDPSEIITLCASTLPYYRMMDVLRIMKLFVENYKQDGIPVIINGISHTLQQAIQSPAVSNISDNDRQILQCNQNLTQMIYNCLDTLGPVFVFGAPANLLTAILEWLITTQIPS